MGWSLENFLKQFVFLDWITKEQATFIKDEMNVPTCLLFVKLDHKITCDENKIETLEAKNVELEKKLEIAMEALEEIRDYGYKPIDKGSVEIWNFSNSALEKINGGGCMKFVPMITNMETGEVVTFEAKKKKLSRVKELEEKLKVATDYFKMSKSGWGLMDYWHHEKELLEKLKV
jgi:hypothetical protein